SMLGSLEVAVPIGRCMVFVFFFQAEDGIRDSSVTGVQTCALPISCSTLVAGDVTLAVNLTLQRAALAANLQAADGGKANLASPRSEERRVGKECRVGWAADS